MEATVCGAVPPFSQALCGKLLVSFLSHPDIIDAPALAEGELLGWSFDMDQLIQLLPSNGMLCLTTKGLYAEHAAIYNRAEAPGKEHPIRMVHLDNTEGASTTLVSTETTRLARQLLEEPGSESARVSPVYGSGGSKRHRAIEKATIQVGLPVNLAMTGIRRPVYGMNFVTNPAAVSWLGEAPDWLVRRPEDRKIFSARATALWRQRWLERAKNRIADYVVLPSMVHLLEQ
jgi:hypothetical protein